MAASRQSHAQDPVGSRVEPAVPHRQHRGCALVPAGCGRHECGIRVTMSQRVEYEKCRAVQDVMVSIARIRGVFVLIPGAPPVNCRQEIDVIRRPRVASRHVGRARNVVLRLYTLFGRMQTVLP